MDRRQKLAKALAKMSEITPSQGLLHALVHSVLFFGLLITVFVFWQRDVRVAVLATFALSLVYTAILVTAHDSIHRTYTGIKWFDDYWPVCWTATMYWPHRTYGEIHKLHHAMLGRNFEDPERPTFLRSEYEDAGWAKRWYIRHQWLVNIFVLGGIGFIAKHWMMGRSLSEKYPQMRLAMRRDSTAIALVVPVEIGLAIYFDSLGAFLLSFFILERVGGALLQMRGLAEHYGLWESRVADSTYRQALSARNMKAGWFFRWLFNDLCFHSIHHAYPSIPWYKLGEAHLTIPSFWDEFNTKAIEPKDTYGKVFADGVRSWRLIDDRAH